MPFSPYSFIVKKYLVLVHQPAFLIKLSSIHELCNSTPQPCIPSSTQLQYSNLNIYAEYSFVISASCYSLPYYQLTKTCKVPHLPFCLPYSTASSISEAYCSILAACRMSEGLVVASVGLYFFIAGMEKSELLVWYKGFKEHGCFKLLSTSMVFIRVIITLAEIHKNFLLVMELKWSQWHKNIQCDQQN